MKFDHRSKPSEWAASPLKRSMPFKLLVILGAYHLGILEIRSQMYSEKQADILSLPYVQKSLNSSYSIFDNKKLSLKEEEIIIYRELLELVEQEDGPRLALERLLPELTPDSSTPFYYFAAHLYSQDVDDEKASEYFEETLKRDPNFLNALRAYSSLLIRKRQDYAKAIPLLLRAIWLGSNETSDYGFLGLSYLNLQQYKQAEASYRMAILLDSTIIDWQIGLAQSLISQHKHKDTISILLEILKREPENDQYWTLLANAYIGLDSPRMASPRMALATQALIDRMGKSTTETLNLMATIWLMEGVKEISAEYYLRSIEKDKEGSLLTEHLDAAQNMLSYGNFELSSRLLQSIKLHMADKMNGRQSVFVLRLESKLGLASGNYTKSIPLLEELVEKDAKDGESLLILGEYYTGLGTKEGFAKAKDFYIMATELEDFKVKALLGRAQSCVNQSKYQDAIPLIEEASLYEKSDYVNDYLEKVRKMAVANPGISNKKED